MNTTLILRSEAAHVRDQRPAVDRYGRPQPVGKRRAVNVQRPARDVVHDLPVHVGRFRRLVAFERLQGDAFHLVDGQAAIDFQQLERTVQPIEMLAQLEWPTVVGACYLEGHVAVHEGGIKDRNPGLGFRYELTIEIDDSR